MRASNKTSLSDIKKDIAYYEKTLKEELARRNPPTRYISDIRATLASLHKQQKAAR